MKMMRIITVVIMLMSAGLCAASDDLLSLDARQYNESVTITVRFPYYSTPQDGSLILAILDDDGNILASKSGNELSTSIFTPSTSGTSEWRASAEFTAVSGMHSAAAFWRDNAGISFSRTKRLSGAAEGDGLTDYRILRTPSHSGARMETRAIFSAEPDDDSVYILLRNVGGYYSDRTIEHVSESEDGLIFDFSFPIYNGNWRSELRWKMNGKSFTHEHEFYVSNGTYYDDENQDAVLMTNLGNCSVLVTAARDSHRLGAWLLLLPTVIPLRRKK